MNIDAEVREFLARVYRETGLCVSCISADWFDVRIMGSGPKHALGFIDVAISHVDAPVVKAAPE